MFMGWIESLKANGAVRLRPLLTNRHRHYSTALVYHGEQIRVDEDGVPRAIQRAIYQAWAFDITLFDGRNFVLVSEALEDYASIRGCTDISSIDIYGEDVSDGHYALLDEFVEEMRPWL